MTRNIGSTWSRWDLHVHTPGSFEHNYPGDEENAWTGFLDDLEALPSDITAIGINDYLEVGGYRRVLDARKQGRLENLKLIIPVVEFRIKRFAGHEDWRRVNFHVIFSDEVSPDQIEQEFLLRIDSTYTIREGDEWSGPPTRSRLEELGRRLKEVSPSPTNLVSDLKHGVDNFNVDPESIRALLDGRDVFRGRYLTAIGKAEWDQLAWTAGSIAEKRSIVESVDFVFTACDSSAAFDRSRERLKKASVQSRLLHCSDAHSLSTAEVVNRIGHSMTWIKSLPTFEGLLIARHEYDNRVFVGTEPPSLVAMHEAPTKYLEAVSFARSQGSASSWFNGASVEFNPGLVAIIGNKGSGKSALTDAIGLVADANVEDHLSFLSDKRFRNARSGHAHEFDCTLVWRSGEAEPKSLGDHVRRDRPERVRYLPQHYFEQLCSDVGEEAYADFESELKRVVFSWLPVDRQLGKGSLDELIGTMTGESRERRRLLAAQMSELNAQISSLERTLQPSSINELKGRIDERKRELEAHDAIEPAVPPNSEAPLDPEEIALRDIEQLDVQIATISERRAAIAKALAAKRLVEQAILDVSARIDNIELYISQHLESEEAVASLERAGLKRDEVLTIDIGRGLVAARREEVTTAIEQTQAELAALAVQTTEIETAKKGLVDQLDARRADLRAHREGRARWATRRAEIIGTGETEGSLRHLEAQLAATPQRLRDLRDLEQGRLNLFGSVFNELAGLRDMYRSLFEPIEYYLRDEPLLSEGLTMTVDALVRSDGFGASLLTHIDQSKAGSFFRGGEDSVKALIAQADFDNLESAVGFATQVLALFRATDDDGAPTDDADRQLRSRSRREQVYDFLFGLEYLSPHYALKFGGKEIAQLSPGERGAALLIFYLLVDQSNVPILLDQPEENLDNETVTALLVPAIRTARRRRQVIVVTHNPNLAVYCDADQVLLAELERQPDPKIRYRSGAIEERETRRWLINVLEGTPKAFGKRHAKYSIGSEGQLIFQED